MNDDYIIIEAPNRHELARLVNHERNHRARICLGGIAIIGARQDFTQDRFFQAMTKPTEICRAQAE